MPDIRLDRGHAAGFGSVVWWSMGKARRSRSQLFPGKEDVWARALLRTKLTYALQNLSAARESGKPEGLRDVAFFDDVPRVDLLLKYGRKRTERLAALPL